MEFNELDTTAQLPEQTQSEEQPRTPLYINEAGEELTPEERQKKMIERMKLKNKILTE